MKCFWPCLVLLATAQPAWAEGADAPYYGPMKRWHGIGFKFGYEDRIEKDGSWRIDAAIHGRGEAVDMAMYRAAERARDEGYRYIFFLAGRSSRSPGIKSATVYARPSHDAVPPVGCRLKKATTCYTADVAEVLRILGGPGGTQPGVAIVDRRDQYGREVSYSGYGIGVVANPVQGVIAVRSRTAIAVERLAGRPPENSPVSPKSAPLAGAPARAAVATGPVVAHPATRGTPRQPETLTAAQRYEALLRESQPITGREPTLGWKISD